MKEKMSSLFSRFSNKEMKDGISKNWVYILIGLLCLPIVLAFFTVFVGIVAVLLGIAFVLLALFFLAPEIVKRLAQRGILHAKTDAHVSAKRVYTPVNIETGILIETSQVVNCIGLKTFKSNIFVKEHDGEDLRILISANEEIKFLSFFANYDEVTSTVTLDQGPLGRSARPIPYDMTVLLPKGRKIRVFSARIIEGLFSLTQKMTDEHLIETLDLDVVNSNLRLENFSLPILKINALNLVLKTEKVFVRYAYINAAGSQIDLNFDERAREYSGKIKSHMVLSNCLLNKAVVASSSTNLWGDGSISKSVMISANLLRSSLAISVPNLDLQVATTEKD